MPKELIVINGFDFSRDKLFGIHRNAMEITREFDKILEDHPLNFDVEVAVPCDCKDLKFKNLHVVKLQCCGEGKLNKIKWRKTLLPNYVKENNAVGLDMTLALPSRGHFCIFIYDCIVENHSKECFSYCPILRRSLYMSRVRRSLDNASIVFTDSQYAQFQIRQLYGVDANEMQVAPCAWQHFARFREDTKVLSCFELKEGQYFFALGSHYPYKNFKWIECAALQNPQYSFVVTGSEIERNERWDSKRADNLLYTGYLSDGEIKGLMTHCKAFLHPSIDEGFGIPPLEAMSVGAPCIVSNAASLPEVYADSVHYIDPYNYENINLDAILSEPLTGSPEETLARYSWKKSAKMVLKAIEEKCFNSGRKE